MEFLIHSLMTDYESILRQAPVICVMVPPIHLGAWSMALMLWLLLLLHMCKRDFHSAFCIMHRLTFLLFTIYRLNVLHTRSQVGGPSQQQAAVYEEFARCLPGFLPSSSPPSSSSSSSSSSTSSYSMTAGKVLCHALLHVLLYCWVVLVL